MDRGGDGGAARGRTGTSRRASRPAPPPTARLPSERAQTPRRRSTPAGWTPGSALACLPETSHPFVACAPAAIHRGAIAHPSDLDPARDRDGGAAGPRWNRGGEHADRRRGIAPLRGRVCMDPKEESTGVALTTRLRRHGSRAAKCGRDHGVGSEELSAGAGLSMVWPGDAQAASPDAASKITGRDLTVPTPDGTADASRSCIPFCSYVAPGVLMWPDAFGLPRR